MLTLTKWLQQPNYNTKQNFNLPNETLTNGNSDQIQVQSSRTLIE